MGNTRHATSEETEAFWARHAAHLAAMTYETRLHKPRYKLVAKVSTEQFRVMVANGELKAAGWTASYRRQGNTVPIAHRTACLAVFGRGDNIFLCNLPNQRK